MARLTFLGTADAFHGAGRCHSSYWVDDDRGAFTVDFGPTSLLAAERAGLDPDRLDAVFLTHMHGDHMGGLGVLLCALQHRHRRSRPLTIAGPPGFEGRLAALVDSAYPSLSRKGLGFALTLRRWRVPGEIEAAGRHVRAIRAAHDTFAMACSLRIRLDGAELAFSGDTGWQPELAQLSAGADVLICECTDAVQGYEGHIGLDTLAKRRGELTAGRVFLSHLTAESRVAATEQAAALDVTVADDGMVIDLG